MFYGRRFNEARFSHIQTHKHLHTRLAVYLWLCVTYYFADNRMVLFPPDSLEFSRYIGIFRINTRSTPQCLFWFHSTLVYVYDTFISIWKLFGLAAALFVRSVYFCYLHFFNFIALYNDIIQIHSTNRQIHMRIFTVGARKKQFSSKNQDGDHWLEIFEFS